MMLVNPFVSFPGGGDPPDMTGVTLIPGDSRVTVQWDDNSPGATSYDVYRNGAPVQTGLTESPYINTSLSNGVEYEFVVFAINGFGSTPSDPASATPEEFWDVDNFVIIDSYTDKFDVGWDNPASPPSAGWRLELQPAGDPWDAPTVETPVVNSQTDFGVGVVTSNTPYDLRVRAEDALGSGPWTTISGRLSRPDVPGNLQNPSTNSTEITISWDSPGGAGALTYNVQAQSAGGDWSSPISDVNGITDLSTVISGLSPESSYDVRVQAVNAHATSDWAGINGITTPGEGGGDPGAAEQTDFDFSGLTPASFNTTTTGLYLLLSGAGDTTHHFWFFVSSETDPGVTSFGHMVDISSAITTEDIAGSLASVINGVGDWTAGSAGTVTSVTDITAAARTDATAGTSGCLVTVQTQGADPT